MLAGCPSPVRLGGVIGVKCALRLPRLRRVARLGSLFGSAGAREPVSSAGPRGIFLDLFYASLALISGLVIAGRAGRAVNLPASVLQPLASFGRQRGFSKPLSNSDRLGTSRTARSSPNAVAQPALASFAPKTLTQSNQSKKLPTAHTATAHARRRDAT